MPGSSRRRRSKSRGRKNNSRLHSLRSSRSKSSRHSKSRAGRRSKSRGGKMRSLRRKNVHKSRRRTKRKRHNKLVGGEVPIDRRGLGDLSEKDAKLTQQIIKAQEAEEERKKAQMNTGWHRGKYWRMGTEKIKEKFKEAMKNKNDPYKTAKNTSDLNYTQAKEANGDTNWKGFISGS